jgi:long-chain acyl-CoA synthetase
MVDVFITGVTGFLGRHVAVRLLQRRGEGRLHCLVRAKGAEEGRRRLVESIARVVGAGEAGRMGAELEPRVGDLTLPGLGLSAEDREAVLSRCGQIIHGAADIRFNQDLEDARSRNVGGTREVAALAREALARGTLRRFDWVGTAFVAGLRRDRVGEDELAHEAGWKNPYEQSKYEAELWLREACSDLPLTVFRPSIIVGESSTGATTNFGMLYWPLQVYARGWWRTVVGRPETPVDVVPVDFVADAIEALSRVGRPVGGAYHLTAGEGSLTIDQIAELTQAYFGGPRPRYVSPETFWRWVRPVADLVLWGKKRRVIREGGRFFIPYFSGNPRFDNARTREALHGTGIEVPDVRAYFSVLLDYCVRTDFGKRPEAAATGAGDGVAQAS